MPVGAEDPFDYLLGDIVEFEAFSAYWYIGRITARFLIQGRPHYSIDTPHELNDEEEDFISQEHDLISFLETTSLIDENKIIRLLIPAEIANQFTSNLVLAVAYGLSSG